MLIHVYFWPTWHYLFYPDTEPVMSTNIHREYYSTVADYIIVSFHPQVTGEMITGDTCSARQNLCKDQSIITNDTLPALSSRLFIYQIKLLT